MQFDAFFVIFVLYCDFVKQSPIVKKVAAANGKVTKAAKQPAAAKKPAATKKASSPVKKAVRFFSNNFF